MDSNNTDYSRAQQNAERKTRDTDRWYREVRAQFDLLNDRFCPAEQFSPEQWLDLILEKPVTLQYISSRMENRLKPLINKETFRNWNSWNICEALYFEGIWLTEYLDLSKIKQVDFDNYWGDPEAWGDADEFF